MLFRAFTVFEFVDDLFYNVILVFIFIQGPTLDYDGIHDRSLKHYFRSNNIKRQLQKMHTVRNQESREGAVRGFVDETMASVDYRLKPGPISPYALPQTITPSPPPHRPQALLPVDQYMRTKRGAKQR